MQVRQSRILSKTVLNFRIDSLGEFSAQKILRDNSARLFGSTALPDKFENLREILEKTFNELGLSIRNLE